MAIKIDWTSSELNNASWKLLEEIQKFQQVDAPLWNNLKGCLKQAIEVYLNESIAQEKEQ